MRRAGVRLAPVAAPALIAVLAVTACSSRSVASESDEHALWASAEKEEQALLKHTTTFEDPLLAAYLARIGDRLLADEVRAAGAPGLRFVVLRDPTLNAFAMPNGRIYVHTGLLSRLENEAQLATVLAHEIAHVTQRHALAATRAARGTPVLSTAAAVAASIGGAAAGAAVLGRTANAILGLGLPLATRAAIDGYGPDLERDADGGGLQRLVKAGYDPREAPKAFQVLLGDAGDRGPVETFFFGKRASLQERIEATSRLVLARYASAGGGIAATEELEIRLRPVARENALEDIRLGRFALAQRQLDRVLEATPEDPLAHLGYGELHRLQSQRVQKPDERAGLISKAAERYERAAALDPTLPDPYRQLGLLHYQQKDAPRAKAAFARYLELGPAAPDARRIREYLTELDR